MEELAGRIGEDVPLAENPAKQLAARLQGHLPVVYGAGILTEVAHRWKTQLNENSKLWAFYEELPEANHNAIVGYGLPAGDRPGRLRGLPRGAALHPRVLLRYEFTRRPLDEAGVRARRWTPRGSSPLAQMLSAIFFGDYVSLYLAILDGVDPIADHRHRRPEALAGRSDPRARQRAGGDPEGPTGGLLNLRSWFDRLTTERGEARLVLVERLALGVLRRLAGPLQAVLLALLDAGVAGEKPVAEDGLAGVIAVRGDGLVDFTSARAMPWAMAPAQPLMPPPATLTWMLNLSRVSVSSSGCAGSPPDARGG